MTLPSWQIAMPHKDIREGRLSEAIFAVDLGDVVYGEATLEYKDARVFFQKTYLTKGLINLVENVLSRMGGGKGDPVIQLQAPFDGDNTFHNMWQSFRTRKHPSLETKYSHTYEEPGKYQVLVKVVDIFGNNTNKLLEMKI